MTHALRPVIGIDGVPALPDINDENIRQQVFTHRSFAARPASQFEDPIDDLAPDNEILEYLGDSVLNMCISHLVHELYPGLKVGPHSKVRSLIVANQNLATISVHYRLPERLRINKSQALTLMSSPHIQADLFEAYIGGVYKDSGFEEVKNWIFDLFKPYAEEAYRIIRGEHGLSNTPLLYAPGSTPVKGFPLDTPSSMGGKAEGHLSLLNQYLQQRGKYIEWRFYPSEEGTRTTPVWCVKAMLDGELLAEGKANTKKQAKAEAAKVGLVKLGVQTGLSGVSYPSSAQPPPPAPPGPASWSPPSQKFEQHSPYGSGSFTPSWNQHQPTASFGSQGAWPTQPQPPQRMGPPMQPPPHYSSPTSKHQFRPYPSPGPGYQGMGKHMPPAWQNAQNAQNWTS